MSEARESEFKGNPMIVLANGPDDKYPFQFGLRKAKMILDHVEDIKKFVEKHAGDSKSPKGSKGTGGESLSDVEL
ncbi:MAG: hypothetical protein HYT79_08655 [Elusimicrobia bacterium]|nr:hypothetical protein [Elusimicrobiota bacterium]